MAILDRMGRAPTESRVAGPRDGRFLWWRPLQHHIVEPRSAARNGVSSFQRVAVLTGGMAPAAEARRRSAATRPSPQSRLDGVQRDSSRPMMERGPPNTRKVRSLK